jgi:phospholipase A2
MINTIGSLIGARESGILDCTTYVAGISGSCWALGVLYAGIAGHQTPTPEAAAEHIKSRIATNFLDSTTFNLLTKSPTHKVWYRFSGYLDPDIPLSTCSRGFYLKPMHLWGEFP